MSGRTEESSGCSKAQSLQVESIALYFSLVEHDLFRKTDFHFSGSCSKLRQRHRIPSVVAIGALMDRLSLSLMLPRRDWRKACRSAASN